MLALRLARASGLVPDGGWLRALRMVAVPLVVLGAGGAGADLARSSRSAAAGLGGAVARCMRLGCTRVGSVLDLCPRHAKAEADELFSRFVRSRDGRCTRCGATEGLQCSHHITRGRMWTRWDPDNATTHCRGCHKLLTEHPALHLDWILSTYGTAHWDRLMDRAYGPIVDGRRLSPGPFRRSDLLEALGRLRGVEVRA